MIMITLENMKELLLEAGACGASAKQTWPDEEEKEFEAICKWVSKTLKKLEPPEQDWLMDRSCDD